MIQKSIILFLMLISQLFALEENNQSAKQIVNGNDEVYLTIDQLNQVLLNNMENANSAVANNLQVLGIALAAISILIVIIGFFNFRYKNEIREEIEEKTTYLVNKKFRQESEDIIEDIHKKLNSYVKTSIKKLKKESQKEEFLRNLIFKDLNTILSSELNNGTNISEVFSIYADRYYVISQLTSGDENERKKALRKLSIGAYKQITKLKSFKDYLQLLKDMDVSLDIANEILELESKL